ncbi:hypothetical protein A2223_00135 [Candidatus Falkowbacteria bacterium RIFOXYA2_FULL_35_8]|nr:MAG: hypothetical protein A2223_00135 [Candidatus Falkowbacteria bacterium RIFOXYA2_FULL_35_8]
MRVGDIVLAGDVLAELDARSLYFTLLQAQANLEQGRANLAKIIAGASPEDVDISISSADKAEVDYNNAVANYNAVKFQAEQELKSASTTKDKAYLDYQTALTSQTDTNTSQNQTVINLENTVLTRINISLINTQIALNKTKEIREDGTALNYLGILDVQAKADEHDSYLRSVSSLSFAKILYTQAKDSSSSANIDLAMAAARTASTDILDNLNDMHRTLYASVASNDFTTADIETYKTEVATKIATISADLTSLETAIQNLLSGRITESSSGNTYTSSAEAAFKAYELASTNYDLAEASYQNKLTTADNQVKVAKASWNIAVSQLDYKKAPARSFDILAYSAQVKQLQAAYGLAEKNWQDSSIKSPINGVVTKINFEIGEQVSPTETVVTIVSQNDYLIEVDISETDITKLNNNNEVDITFDSYGDENKFTGKVVSIDPAQTVIQDVIYYLVKIEYEERDFEIKPGMTANVTIHTDQRDDVLYIPRRAIIEKDNKKIVRVLEQGNIREVEVETGLKADDGLIEIKNGLEPGLEIVTFIKETT